MVSLTCRAEMLQDGTAAVETLVHECKLRLSDDGIQITAVDAANVGMVDMAIDASACASYSASDGLIGINVERLTDVIGMADSDDMVHLDLDAETRKLHIEFDGLEFSLATIDPESIRDGPDIPDLDLDGTYVFSGSELSRAVTAADMVSDHIGVAAVDSETLVLDAEGDTDDVEVTLDKDDLLSGRHAGDEAVSSLFSIDYLSDIASPIGRDTELSLCCGDEMPTKIKYSLCDGVSVVNLLAPRIQSGDGR